MNPIFKFICIAAIILPVMACKCPAQATLPSDFSVPLPKIPDRTFKISDFGAKADGKTFDTRAFQSAIDACTKAGGGTVDVPPGQYLVTPFVLASNLNLHLESGATLRLTPNPDDYNLVDGLYDSAITLKDGHDIAITGAGTIDGQGIDSGKSSSPQRHRPHDLAMAPAPPGPHHAHQLHQYPRPGRYPHQLPDVSPSPHAVQKRHHPGHPH